MPIITLTTDFGIKDHFVGAVKGAIYCNLPDAKIVDISHLISPFNITEAAYVLRNAYKNFPKGSIHIVGVDSELSIKNKHLVIELDNHFFICPDNGIISMITSEFTPKKIIEITPNTTKSSFAVLDVFVKVACHIANNGSLTDIGCEIDDYKKLIEIQPKVNQKQSIIKGEVIYIDNYGNVISNISKPLFDSIANNRNFTVTARRYHFTKIHEQYNDIVNYNNEYINLYDGDKLALFNTAGFLEIAIYRSNLDTVGGASSLLGLDYRDTIAIEFEEIITENF